MGVPSTAEFAPARFTENDAASPEEAAAKAGAEAEADAPGPADEIRGLAGATMGRPESGAAAAAEPAPLGDGLSNNAGPCPAASDAPEVGAMAGSCMFVGFAPVTCTCNREEIGFGRELSDTEMTESRKLRFG